jgi:lambda family phage tail tape measure protein
MATTDAIVNVKVVGQAALTGLENSIQRLQKRFGGLQAAVAGLGLAALARNALVAADDMTDLSNATGVTITKILELQFALEAAGGRFDQMAPLVTKFSMTLGEAYDGSLKAQRAFQKLGVSLEDLRTLSEEDLLDKTISGLSDIGNASKRNAAAVEIFGKAVKGVALDQLGTELAKLQGTQNQYSDSIEKAARLQGNLEVAMLRVRTIVLEAVSPFVNFANALLETASGTEKLANAIDILLNILLIFTGGALFRSIAALIGSLGRGFKAMRALASGAKGAKDAFHQSSTQMNAFRTSMTVAGAAGVGLAGTTIELNEETKEYNNTLEQTAQKLPTVEQANNSYAASIQGLQMALQAGKITLQEFQAEVTKADEIRKKLLEQITPKKEEKAPDTSELDRQLATIKEVTQSYIDQSNAQLLGISRTIQQIGLTDEQKAAQDAYNTSIDNATKAILELESKKKDLKKEDVEQLATINAQQKAIRERMIADAMAAEQAQSNASTLAKYNADLAEDIKLLNQLQSDESSLALLQKQVDLIGLTSDELQKKTIALEVQSELENKLAEIQKRRNELAAKAAQFGADSVSSELERLSIEEQAARDYADRRLAIEKELQDKTIALRNNTALASKQFLEDLARSVDPAVLTAKKWEAAFGGIESAIDQLVTTGKFNFKDFALSIIADLLKIQMRAIVVQAILSAIGAIFGGGRPTAAVGSSISPIPGVQMAANGAKTLAGKPFIVGEQGPELFVPKTAGTIVPNGQMGGQVNAPVTNVVNNYNISAVDAKSVAQLFAENRKSLLGAVGMAQKEMPYMMAG